MSDAGNTRFDVDVECPACGTVFQAPRIRRGATEPCPVCGYRARVPGEGAYDESPAPASAEAAPPAVAAWAAPAGPVEPVGPTTGECIVLAQDDQRLNPMLVGPLVAEATGMNPAQAKLNAVRGRGVLAEHVPAAVAEGLARGLTNMRAPALVLPQEAVPLVEKQLPVIRVQGAREDALYLQADVQGTLRTLPWDVLLAGFCSVENAVRSGMPNVQTETDTVFAPGGAYTIRRTNVPHARRPPHPVCTLVVRGRSGNVYTMQFHERKIRYSYLGARRGTSSAQNFGLFLADLIRYCPHAFFPGSTRAVAAGQRMKMIKLRDDADYARYLQWVLCRAAAQARQNR